MYESFLAYLTDSGMAALLREKGAVLAAYSGGADSTLLLHWLARYCLPHQIRLYAAHVHHGIRGTEADRDAAHCVKTTDALGIPLYTARVDVPALAAQRSIGVEECARIERYAFFDATCRALGMPDMLVATAHNADDQTETVLFHMLRGSGLAGMTGISPIRDRRYIRPMLFMSAEDIRRACVTGKYSYVEDSTNGDTVYTRNYIRHEILPKLRTLQPHPEKAVQRMTELLTRDNDYLEGEAAAWLEKTRMNGRYDCLNREILRQVHPAIGTRLLRMCFEQCFPGGSMTREQTEDVLRLAAGTETKLVRVTLPGNREAVIRSDAVVFAAAGKQQIRMENIERQPEDIWVSAIAPGETVILDWGIHKIVLSRENLPKRPENLENIYNLSIQHHINFATIKGVLCLRTRKAGDTILYKGMHRKIRKLQNENHTPPDERETMIVLADEEEILWVQGLGACDKAYASGNTDDPLWIQLYRNTEKTI